MNKELLTIIGKELRRVFTDRRLVFTALIMPGLILALTYSLIGQMVGKMVSDTQEHTPVIMVQALPKSLTPYMQEAGFDIQSAEEDIAAIQEQIRTGDLDMLLVFDDDFDQAVNGYEGAHLPQVQIYYNPSEDFSQSAYYKVDAVLSQYKQDILAGRLGGEAYTEVFASTAVETYNEQKASGRMLGMLLPMLVTMFLFAGAMQIGIDSIAGEKERGTMANLLLTPIPRRTIAFGKLISLGVVAIISAFSSFLGIMISLPFSSYMFTGGQEVDLAIRFTPLQILQLILLMITLTGVFVGIICTLSVYAKSVKEAGSTITPAYLVVMFCGMIPMFSQATPSFSQFLVPVYGSVLALKAFLVGELAPLAWLACCVENLVLAGLLGVLTGKLFDSEKVMFGI
jgi:sodium transport system permease protein